MQLYQIPLRISKILVGFSLWLLSFKQKTSISNSISDETIKFPMRHNGNKRETDFGWDKDDHCIVVAEMLGIWEQENFKKINEDPEKYLEKELNLKFKDWYDYGLDVKKEYKKTNSSYGGIIFDYEPKPINVLGGDGLTTISVTNYSRIQRGKLRRDLCKKQND